MEKQPRFCIAMVSDFFYPNMGGVEGHIYSLAQCLLARGHKVIVITHAYNSDLSRVGVRWLTNGLKVYYLPIRDFYNKVSFPTIYGFLPLIRDVLLREQVQLVHAHSAFSTLGSESILHGRSLGLRAVFTDHSLFGFADISSILTNKLLRFGLCDADHAICVSHTCKENTALRSFIDPRKVSVIANAIDGAMFTPAPERRDPKWITVVVVSRLVYRKGADLLAGIIPDLCDTYPQLKFLIGGDGDKRLALEEIREQYNLHDRVVLLGSIANHEVRDVLVQGDIFLNTSLTEAFCIAIVEAICCGLSVVSTNVGGIPEVVPSDVIRLVEPSVSSINVAMREAIEEVIRGERPDPWQLHHLVTKAYTWPEVARRTERVYSDALASPKRYLPERLRAVYGIGPIAGKVFCVIVLVEMLILFILELWRPAASIEPAANYTDQKPSNKNRPTVAS